MVQDLSDPKEAESYMSKDFGILLYKNLQNGQNDNFIEAFLESFRIKFQKLRHTSSQQVELQRVARLL